MTTWRVPEDLKAEIQTLVPGHFRSVSEAVSSLCRSGLTTLSQNEMTQNVAEEEFYVLLKQQPPRGTGANQVTFDFPLCGYPLVQLSLLSIRYVGPEESQVAHSSIQLYQGERPLMLSHTPLAWATEDLKVDVPPFDPTIAPISAMIIAHDGWMLPRGNVYFRLRRAQ